MTAINVVRTSPGYSISLHSVNADVGSLPASKYFGNLSVPQIPFRGLLQSFIGLLKFYELFTLTGSCFLYFCSFSHFSPCTELSYMAIYTTVFAARCYAGTGGVVRLSVRHKPVTYEDICL